MDNDEAAPVLYRAAWPALVLVMCALLVVWGVSIAASLGSGTKPTMPVSQPTDVPQIVTVNPDLGLPDPRKLCAEIAPQPATITIVSVAGSILSTSRC